MVLSLIVTSYRQPLFIQKILIAYTRTIKYENQLLLFSYQKLALPRGFTRVGLRKKDTKILHSSQASSVIIGLLLLLKLFQPVAVHSWIQASQNSCETSRFSKILIQPSPAISRRSLVSGVRRGPTLRMNYPTKRTFSIRPISSRNQRVQINKQPSSRLNSYSYNTFSFFFCYSSEIIQKKSTKFCHNDVINTHLKIVREL